MVLVDRTKSSNLAAAVSFMGLSLHPQEPNYHPWMSSDIHSKLNMPCQMQLSDYIRKDLVMGSQFHSPRTTSAPRIPYYIPINNPAQR